jgi:4-aminobutyrate aminotransferase/(S)-3-amino-2-methylpropionate transaminase
VAGQVYSRVPRAVPPVKTRFRCIQTALPVPESLPVLERLERYEPRSMQGQPPIVWDRAEGFCVYDRYGNQWLDWSSGVLVANAGHAHPAIVSAIVQQAERHLLHNYCFPSEVRAALAQRLVELAPPELNKAFLLTTGSETTENALKLARTHGLRVGGREKITLVTFHQAFHGRTLGAQMAGGIPSLKEWIVNLDPNIIQVPFPDGFRCKDQSFDLFLRSLREQGFEGRHVAGVMLETYQGGGASFAPPEYMQQLRAWCSEQEAVLICDEVQAGFGRCGTLWGFEHYGIVPDLMCLGKGISSGLPVSAVVGRADLMDQYPPGSMTSTHTGNPICCAAALASIEVLLKEGLVENAARQGEVLHAGLAELQAEFPEVIGAVHGRGLVAGVHVTRRGSEEPDGELAFRVVERCMEKGLLLFSPVGFGGATLKIAPPLCITTEAVQEGVSVLREAFAECTA